MDINNVRRDYQQRWLMHVFEVSAKKLKEIRHRKMIEDFEKVIDEIIEEGEQDESN